MAKWGEYFPHLRFVKENQAAELPEKAFYDDAGFDLALPKYHWFDPGETSIVGLGLSVRLERGEWGLLIGRSSTLPRYELLVTPGVIDGGYEGELKAVVRNLGTKPVRLGAGTKLFQFIPMLNAGYGREPVWEPKGSGGSERGSGGFGSSGT